jgi:hypothetical protein
MLNMKKITRIKMNPAELQEWSVLALLVLDETKFHAPQSNKRPGGDPPLGRISAHWLLLEVVKVSRGVPAQFGRAYNLTSALLEELLVLAQVAKLPEVVPSKSTWVQLESSSNMWDEGEPVQPVLG